VSNIVEFAIKLKDMMSGGLVQLTSNATKSMGGVYKAMEHSARGSRQFKNSVTELESRLNSLNKVRFSTKIVSQFNEATREAKRLERQIDRLRNGFASGVGGRVSAWRQEFVQGLPGGQLLSNPLLLAGATMGGAWKATQAAMQAGKDKMQLQVMAGDAQGKSLYDQLTKYATDTVFGTEVYGHASSMLGAGLKAEEVMPMMKMLGDVSMGDSNKLDGLSYAISQVKGAGVLRGQEKIQLENSGFYPLQQIMKKTGETFQEVSKRMEEGKISFQEVYASLEAATGAGGKFHNMLAKIADTPAGQLAQIKGTLDQMMVRVGNVFLPIASKLMQAISWIAEKMGPVLEPLVAYIGTLTAGILAVAAAQWLWNAAVAANPIGLVIVAIAAAAVAIYALWQKSEKFRAVIRGIGAALKDFGKLILEVLLAPLKLVWGVFSNILKSIWFAITGEWKKAADSAKNVLLEATGANTAKRIYENGKQIGESFNKGFQDSLAKDRTENIRKVIGEGGDVVALATAFQDLGKKYGMAFRNALLGEFEYAINHMVQFTTRMFGKNSIFTKEAIRISNAYKGVGAITNSNILPEVTVTPGGKSSNGIPSPGAATNTGSNITGSGVRSIVFNIDTLGVKGGMTINAQNVSEGAANIRDIVVEQLNRALDSVGGAVAY